MKKRKIRIPGIIAAIVVVLIVILSSVSQEPLRQYLEREINSRLKGYSIQIRELALHPFTLSVDFKTLLLREKENPDSPIAAVRKVHGSISWRDLLTGKLAGDLEILEPRLYVNLQKLKQAMAKAPPAKEAWQDVVQSLYPLTINAFTLENGEVTYVEDQDGKPVTISGIKISAANISNVRTSDRVYPSDVLVQAVLFGSGSVTVNGQADFLLKPFMGLKADLSVQRLDLTGLKPIAYRQRVAVAKGLVSAAGTVEFSPRKKIFILKDLTLSEAEIDYIHVAAAAGAEKQAAKKAKKTAQELAEQPEILVKAERIQVVNGNFGVINRAAKPDYRVYVNNADMMILNFSNKFSEGPAHLHLKGRFMGSGETAASGVFRSEKNGPDFDFRIAIQDTRMPAMNDIFRAYGNFDITAGFFSFYSELAAKDNRITGYVKPLFKDLKVYDKRSDKEKNEFRKLYEKIIGGVGKFFENRPRDQVATETPISGKIENPNASTWEIIVNLVQNAFSQAILPGFEENIKK